MEQHQKLDSYAEKKAQDCLTFNFCSSLNLQQIKDTLAIMLNHIGDNDMFAEYTMHDISHVNGMLALLDKIIPDNTKYIMTKADWLMTVLAIYFHDLGMHIPQGEYDKRESDTDYLKIKKKMLGTPSINSYYLSLDGDKGEKFLYQEYVRKNHGKRIFNWIANCDKHDEEPYKMISELLSGLDKSFRSDLALICQSHQLYELPEHLKSVDEAYGSAPDEKVNLMYVSVLLRSSDILHMTHDRTPEIEYRIISPQNEISVIEWAKQRAVRSVDIHYEKNELGEIDKSISPHLFEIQAKFDDDKGYFSFKEFLNNWAIPELQKCYAWSEESKKKNSNEYYFPWKGINTERVQAEGFSKNKLRFEIDQRNILRLLTGHTLYNDSTVVLRELIQNATDAGKLQNSKSKSSKSYQCKIEISWDSTTRILKVADNATGMDTESISNYLLKVGASKYQSESFKKDYPDFHSISRFGIGLLTCFMISDDVDVYTLDEEENQCHLLKIRNLNGEYLMRNDADTSKILEGKHGTTFELKVRSEIDMRDIEQQIRQWIFIPYGEISLTVDGGTPIKIGYKDTKEAVEMFVSKINGVDLTSGRYRVVQSQIDGIEMSVLQWFNTISRVWSLYNYRENEFVKDAPIGICVEGIRVTTKSPGIMGRNYLALVNCVGEGSPTTNVARNDLEGGSLLEKMNHNIYKMYIDTFLDQMTPLTKEYSLTWSTSSINYLIESFSSFPPYTRFDNREILGEELRKAKCNAIDNGKNVYLMSLNEMPEKICTLDSKAFNAAVSLLKDMKKVDKTAYGLISELEQKEIGSDIILLNYSMANCIYDLFMEDYEVDSIQVDELKRRIKFTWKRGSGRWKHINLSRTRIVGHVFVLLDNEVDINGLNNKYSIFSDNCIFLLKDSPLLSFYKRLIFDLKVGDDILEQVSELVLKLIRESRNTENQSLERFLNSDDNYIRKTLFESFTKDELKEALKGCTDNVLEIDKYYRYN